MYRVALMIHRRNERPMRSLPAFALAIACTSFALIRVTNAQPSADSGDCPWHRPKLAGDLFGIRPCLAERGITFDADVTQFYQGVASGGRRQRFRYGGHGDYVLNFDFGKLGVHKGLYLQIRAEHRFGKPVNLATGAVIPVALSPNLPVPGDENLMLTNVLFTQDLSESLALFFGKMDTLDGDPNAFAHGRGKDQFLNSAFVFNPIAVRTIPYSTLGAGFVLLRDASPVFTFTILNATDTSGSSGFDELFANGVALGAELRLPVELQGLPGHQLFGATWNSKEYVALGQDPRVIVPGSGVPIERKRGSWSLRYNFDQYLYVDPSDPRRGWGLFGRAGLSDGNPNPLKWFLSFGVGGSSPIPGRAEDSFGVGWYYAGASDELGPLVNIDDGQGVEIYYNAAVRPWFHLTTDLQIIGPGLRNTATAVVVGLRGKMDF